MCDFWLLQKTKYLFSISTRNFFVLEIHYFSLLIPRPRISNVTLLRVPFPVCLLTDDWIPYWFPPLNVVGGGYLETFDYFPLLQFINNKTLFIFAIFMNLTFLPLCGEWIRWIDPRLPSYFTFTVHKGDNKNLIDLHRTRASMPPNPSCNKLNKFSVAKSREGGGGLRSQDYWD